MTDADARQLSDGRSNGRGDDQLASYRASIDNIDAALVHLLAERFKITKAVGYHKAVVGLPASDPVREDHQIARLRALASESGLDPTFTESFLRFIVSEVIRHHQALKGEGQSPSPLEPPPFLGSDGPAR